jgi:hypothetical protein
MAVIYSSRLNLSEAKHAIKMSKTMLAFIDNEITKLMLKQNPWQYFEYVIKGLGQKHTTE